MNGVVIWIILFAVTECSRRFCPDGDYFFILHPEYDRGVEKLGISQGNNISVDDQQVFLILVNDRLLVGPYADTFRCFK